MPYQELVEVQTVGIESRQEAWQCAVELLGKVDMVFVSSVDREGYPRTGAMLNLRNRQRFPGLTEFFGSQADPLVTYLSTNTFLPKVVRMRENPKVCLNFTDLQEWKGLQVVGHAVVVEDDAVKRALWQDGWEMYYPGGVTDPDFAIIRVDPVFAQYYHQLQHFHFDLATSGGQDWAG